MWSQCKPNYIAKQEKKDVSRQSKDNDNHHFKTIKYIIMIIDN